MYGRLRENISVGVRHIQRG